MDDKIIELTNGKKIIKRKKVDWERNQDVWKFRGFKLYSEEKKSTPKKKKRGKDV